jgi:hypothetical protein
VARPAVALVTAAVAEGPGNRREQHRDGAEDGLLTPRERQLAVVVAGKDHHLERVREAALADLAVGREPEERLEEGLDVQRRPELDERRDLLVARVPPDVATPGGTTATSPGW